METTVTKDKKLPVENKKLKSMDNFLKFVFILEYNGLDSDLS